MAHGQSLSLGASMIVQLVHQCQLLQRSMKVAKVVKKEEIGIVRGIVGFAILFKLRPRTSDL
jgi:hypothetical protein